MSIRNVHMPMTMVLHRIAFLLFFACSASAWAADAPSPPLAAASASATASATASAPAIESAAPIAASASASAVAPLPSIAPPPASSAAPSSEGAVVRLRDARLFWVLVPRLGQSAEERARLASAALRAVAENAGRAEVRVERHGDEAVLLAGDRPILTFGPDDALASRDASAAETAERAAGRLREVLAKEQSRSAALLTLLSVALVVLSGMVALFFARKIGQLADRARGFLEQHPERIPAIRLQSIEVVRPESLRAALLIATAASRVLLRLGVIYGWVLIGLSLFEPTRAYAERLSGFVFGPLYSLLARLIGSLPLLVVTAIAAIALIVLVRFVGLFFDGVARGQTNLDWLPADLAAPTSILVRAFVVIGFFVVAAPLVAGDDDGALARAGTVVVAALGLSATPIIASAAVGIVVVYGRRITVGDWVEMGAVRGRVRAVRLLEVELLVDGGVLRVPHLRSLLRPTRIYGPELPVLVLVSIAPSACKDEEARLLLAAAAESLSKRAEVELMALDSEGAHYRVTAHCAEHAARFELVSMVVETLSAAGVSLGRSGVRLAPSDSPSAT